MKSVDGLLDTSVIVRYLIGDSPRSARKATQIIENSRAIGVTAATIAEVGFALTKFYGVPRDEAVRVLTAILNRRNLVTIDLDKSIAIEAIQFCAPSGRVSFADAMIWATARSFGIPIIYTFDEKFPNRGVEILGEFAGRLPQAT